MTDKSFWDHYKIWEEITLSPEKNRAYESRLKKVLDEQSAIREAELRLERIQKEKAEGIKNGIEKAKKTVARRLLEKGMDIDTIAEVTGLEKERISEIQ